MAAPEPERRLSPLARWVWRAQQVGMWGVLVVIGAAVAANVDGAGVWPWVLPLAGLVIGTAAVPPLLWARWRWDVREEGIDIRHGALTVRRTLVPWVRVQHVDTRRGLLEQGFGLSTVVVHTAAGGHTIPLLPESEAEGLRERIAGLARSEEADEAAPPGEPAPPAGHDAPAVPAGPAPPADDAPAAPADDDTAGAPAEPAPPADRDARGAP